MTLDLVYYLVMDGVVLDVAFISKTHCSAFATHVGIPPSAFECVLNAGT